MMNARTVLLASILLAGAFLVMPAPEPGDSDLSVFRPVSVATAQDPNNTTVPPTPSASTEEGIIVVARAIDTYKELKEFTSAEYRIRLADYSLPGAVFRSSPPQAKCTAELPQDTNGWSVNPGRFTDIPWEGTAETSILVAATSRPTPEYVKVYVECKGTKGVIAGDVIGAFNVTARVEEYTYLVMSSGGLPETMAPDEVFSYTFTLTNNGNQPKLFQGEVNAPDGWKIVSPPTVLVEPGTTANVTIQGLTPRDKPLYLSEQALFQIRYWPQGEEGKAQTLFVPFKMNGVYLHPAIVPFTLLAIILTGVFLWLAILTRRHIEEQILGKPVPPWRLPEEQEYLAKLEKEDPDEFYTIRYYLMVEEHRSAVLWYEAYKKATKSDRKKETKWVKLKNRQEAKAERLDNKVGRVDKKFDRKVKFARWREGRKVKKLQRKHEKYLRKGQKKIDKKHTKRVNKIEKKHAKKVKKALKKHDKLVAKETKKVEKENKKRAKRDEGPLPLPEIETPDMGEPERPEREEIQEVPLEEGRYAPKLERLNARFDKKVERIERRRSKKKDRRAAKIDKKKGKVLDKIPPEPETNLYVENEFVPEDEVVVEEDRSPLERILHIPTLEERERARRRRAVYLARRAQLKEAGDEQALAALEADYKADKKGLSEEARAEAASKKEEKALAKAEAKAKKKAIKERAKELAQEAEEEAAGPETVAGPKKKAGFLAKIKPGTGDDATDPVPDDAPEEAPAEATAAADAADDDGDKKPGLGGILAKVRPGKQGKDLEADSEDTKEEPAAPTSAGPDGSQDKE